MREPRYMFLRFYPINDEIELGTRVAEHWEYQESRFSRAEWEDNLRRASFWFGKLFSPVFRKCRRAPSKSLKQAVRGRDGDICGFCRRVIDTRIKFPDPFSESFDHFPIPVDSGGKTELNNLRVAHLVCNRNQGPIDHERYAQYLELGRRAYWRLYWRGNENDKEIEFTIRGWEAWLERARNGDLQSRRVRRAA